MTENWIPQIQHSSELQQKQAYTISDIYAIQVLFASTST